MNLNDTVEWRAFKKTDLTQRKSQREKVKCAAHLTWLEV
jgi:hypothetical protein